MSYSMGKQVELSYDEALEKVTLKSTLKKP